MKTSGVLEWGGGAGGGCVCVCSITNFVTCGTQKKVPDTNKCPSCLTQEKEKGRTRNINKGLRFIFD